MGAPVNQKKLHRSYQSLFLKNRKQAVVYPSTGLRLGDHEGVGPAELGIGANEACWHQTELAVGAAHDHRKAADIKIEK